MANAPTPKDLARLAAYTERRIADLGLQYAEVARMAEFSDQTLIAIRSGKKVRPTTYRKLEMALRWAAGSAQAIMDGGEPTPLADESGSLDADEPQVGRDAPAEAESKQLRELELARRLLGATVREMGLTPEEAEEAWRRVRLDIERPRNAADQGESSHPGRRDRAG